MAATVSLCLPAFISIFCFVHFAALCVCACARALFRFNGDPVKQLNTACCCLLCACSFPRISNLDFDEILLPAAWASASFLTCGGCHFSFHVSGTGFAFFFVSFGLFSNYLHIYYKDYEDSCFLNARAAVVRLSRSLASDSRTLRAARVHLPSPH